MTIALMSCLHRLFHVTDTLSEVEFMVSSKPTLVRYTLLLMAQIIKPCLQNLTAEVIRGLERQSERIMCTGARKASLKTNEHTETHHITYGLVVIEE